MTRGSFVGCGTAGTVLSHRLDGDTTDALAGGGEY